MADREMTTSEALDHQLKATARLERRIYEIKHENRQLRQACLDLYAHTSHHPVCKQRDDSHCDCGLTQAAVLAFDESDFRETRAPFDSLPEEVQAVIEQGMRLGCDNAVEWLYRTYGGMEDPLGVAQEIRRR